MVLLMVRIKRIEGIEGTAKPLVFSPFKTTCAALVYVCVCMCVCVCLFVLHDCFACLVAYVRVVRNPIYIYIYIQPASATSDRV